MTEAIASKGSYIMSVFESAHLFTIGSSVAHASHLATRTVDISGYWSAEGLEWCISGMQPGGEYWSASGLLTYAEFLDGLAQGLYALHTDIMASLLWVDSRVRFSQDCFDFCADVADGSMYDAVNGWEGFTTYASAADAEFKAINLIGTITALLYSGYLEARDRFGASALID